MPSETERTIYDVTEENDPLSIQGELEQSTVEGLDLVPGKKIDSCKNHEASVGNDVAVNDNSNELYASDDFDEAEQQQETKKEEEEKVEKEEEKEEEEVNVEDMRKIRAEEKRRKRKLFKTSKRKKSAPENLNVFEETKTNIAFTAFIVLWQVLSYGKPLSLTNKQKAFAIVIWMSWQFLTAAASPIQHINEPIISFEYKVLKTSHCDRIGFWKHNQCERNERIFQIYIDGCGLADKCDPGFKPTCVEGKEGEALLFCSPAELSCKAGYRRKARKKENDVVIVEEEKCPHGWYQPFQSDCYSACAYSHRDLKELPDQFAVYYVGDDVSPPLIYCDFDRGFYSSQGIFLYRYDDEMKYDSFECTNVNVYNPCSSGKVPLPDGSCVSPCETGFTRDVNDGFRCKEIHDVEYPQETDKEIDAKDVNGFVTLLERHPNMTTPAEYTATQDWHVTVVIVLLIVALLFVIASILTIYNTPNDRLAIGGRFYKRMCGLLMNEEL